MENVILVNENDTPVGVMEKMEAHRKGVLHRAISVIVFNSKGEILLQKRARNKYHSGGLWTNACCSHPLPDENPASAARRRLKEEMGIDLHPEFSHKFIYKVSLDHDLTEHELDHVFIATFNGEPAINTEEVEDWRFVNLTWLKQDMSMHPDSYTYWFKLIIDHPQFQNTIIN
jgi:isopentenyl-diphosphate delta-isomerase